MPVNTHDLLSSTFHGGVGRMSGTWGGPRGFTSGQGLLISREILKR